VVIMVMLRGQKVSLQTAVNKSLSAFGAGWRGVTAGAYRQARQKVQPEVFVHLNAVACEEDYARYGAEGEVVLWQGHRGLGREGSYLKLPDTAETRREFRVQIDQDPGAEQGQA
jgi:hypothetical protein